jgi:choline-glycine betaine transporter
VIVVAVIVVTMVIMGGRRMSVAVAMPVIAVMVELVARGVAGMRADERDQASQNGAQQRQENDCLNHLRAQPFIRLTSSTAIEPRLRK